VAELQEAEARAWGCLAGLALGDALGMPTEFMTPEQIVTTYGRVEGFVSSPAGHPHARLPLARVTDDTEQALALAGVYVQQGKMTAEAMAQALLDWADAHGPALALYVGPSTRRALDLLREGSPPRQSGQGGKTNGAAMRIAPVGIVRAGNLESALHDTVEACLPTHGTTLAISGAVAIAWAVAEAMRGASLDSVLDAAVEGAQRGRQHGAWAWTPPLEKRIALALQLVQGADDEAGALQSLYDYVGVDLVVVETVPTALGLVALAGGEPMPAIRYAANLGGDTDTIGAIAGAICGALHGIQAIDAAMLATVEAANDLHLRRIAQKLVAPHDRPSLSG
jgi:ADP-ribosylglycohydrolase